MIKQNSDAERKKIYKHLEYSFQMFYLCKVNKRDNILKSALKLFVDQGEQATSMKWIASEAKCGIGTMYNYFQSKEELINELYVEIKTRLFTYTFDGHNTDVPVKQQFIGTWLKFIDYAIINPYEYKFLQVFAHSPKISKQATEKVNKLISPVLEIFEKGKREGIIKDHDALQLLIFTNGAITASVLINPDIDESGKMAIILLAWDAIKS